MADAEEPAATDSDLVAVELAFWDTVKGCDNPAMFEAYLERYPEGAFAAQECGGVTSDRRPPQRPIETRLPLSRR
jgi:hypothetical protein